jgi:hypothetical protein
MPRKEIPLIERSYSAVTTSGRKVKVNVFDYNIRHALISAGKLDKNEFVHLTDGSFIGMDNLKLLHRKGKPMVKRFV